MSEDFEPENVERIRQDAVRIHDLTTQVGVLKAALRGVLRVADRKTQEFDEAHAALEQEGEP